MNDQGLMSVRRGLVCLLVLMASIWVGGPGFAQDDEAGPRRFAGKSIPDPPQQASPWTAPATKLPKFLVDATGPLFEQGVADPRGCEYRVVEINDRVTRSGHGFVLPERPDVPGRFVIAWDGLIYPTLKVGEPADLDADIRLLAASFTRSRQERGNSQSGLRMSRKFPGTPTDWDGLTGVQDNPALKLCLLLRLGRADLALDVFTAATGWTPQTVSMNLSDLQINPLTLASGWLTSANDRLTAAYIHQDNVIALDLARRMTRFRDLATPRLDKLGFRREDRQGLTVKGQPIARFPNLGQLDAVHDELERRAKLPPRMPIPPKGGDPAARIAALIRDLDLIEEHPMMSPGQANVADSPLVKALVDEGDAAVEPLLAVLESDDRLTLTATSSYRNLDLGSAYIQPVYVAAFEALVRLIRSNDFEASRPRAFQPLDPQARKALARAIRDDWAKNRAITQVEQWYRVLLDDKAPVNRWISVAQGLSSPRHEPGDVWPPPPNRPPQGEPLRVGKDPSVTTLMVRRIEEIRRRIVVGTIHDPSLEQACSLAHSLAAWDGPAALPILRELMQECRERSDRWLAFKFRDPSDRTPVISLAGFTTARVKLGDLRALDEYADWIRTTTPAMLGFSPIDSFRPLIDHPEHPALASAARWLFTDKESPWVPLLGWASGGRDNPFVNDYASPLVIVPAFREGLQAGLLDKSPLGSVKKKNQGQVEYRFRGSIPASYSGWNSMIVDVPDVEVAFRTCDYIASKVAEIEGAPQCVLHWPEARRDEAVAKLGEFLNRHGSRFIVGPRNKPDYFGSPEVQVRLNLSNLGRVATADDVAQARAIFTLEGPGEAEVRLVPLPKFPQAARWVTLKDTPMDQPDDNDQLKRTYLTDGWIWQAEEIRKGDRWERYYGYVGRHTVARVPASEIEFGGLVSGWGELSGGLDVRLGPVEPHATMDRSGQPIAAVVEVRNRLGVERSSPTELLRVGPDGKPALRRGITPEIWYSPPKPLTRSQLSSMPRTLIPPTRSSHFEPGDASRPLATLASFEACRFVVNDWFDVAKPGRYECYLKFGPESGLGAGMSSVFVFEVGEAR